MSKLTKEQIDKRRKRMKEEALNRVAKTEQLNIRMDEFSIMQLYARAESEGKPVGTLVREWIVEKLDTKKQTQLENKLEQILEIVASFDERLRQIEKTTTKKK